MRPYGQKKDIMRPYGQKKDIMRPYGRLFLISIVNVYK
jgi:hypothetical protein